MYSNPSAPLAAGGGAGVLALTGGNIVWLVLAAFALVALGAALWRISPRRSETVIDRGHWE